MTLAPASADEPLAKPPLRPGADWRGFVAAGVIAAATTAAYSNSFGGPFVYDDLKSIVENPTIRHLWPLGPVLHPPGGGATVEGRPLINLSLAINYAAGGTRVAGYHGFNLVFHVLAGLAWFGILRRTLPRLAPAARAAGTWAALILALLWTLHPLQTESVTYVVQRAEGLMGLFYLTTLYSFIRGAESGRRRWLGIAVLTCALGMASKEVMVSAPVVVLLYDRTFFAGSFRAAWQLRRWFYGGLAATWILLAALVIGAGGNRSGSAGFGGSIGWTDYALTQFLAVAHYLRLMVWPGPLVFDYGPFHIEHLSAILPDIFVLTILASAAALALWRWPIAGFLGGWFFAVLAPTSLVPGPTQMVAEHRMYLALAPALAALAGLLWLAGAKQRPSVSLALGLLACAACGVLTYRRNRDYRSAFALWADTLVKRPASARAQNEVGVELAQLPGHELDAVAHYEAALRLNPDFAEAHLNLGLVLMQQPGRRAAAVEQFEAAVRLKPGYAKAQLNLANALAQPGGAWAEAVDHYRMAQQSEPDDPDLRLALGNALLHLPGQTAAAEGEYEAALRLRPDYAEAHFNLANLLAEQPNRAAEALDHYRSALRINPSYAEAELNWADALAGQSGKIPEALLHYGAALRIRPNYPAALNNRAVALARLGRWDDAMADLELALRIDPTDDQARQNLKGLRLKRAGL